MFQFKKKENKVEKQEKITITHYCIKLYFLSGRISTMYYDTKENRDEMYDGIIEFMSKNETEPRLLVSDYPCTQNLSFVETIEKVDIEE